MPLSAPEAEEPTDALRLPLGLDGHDPNGSGSCTLEVIDARSFLRDRYCHE
jgi:hypothetical protein